MGCLTFFFFLHFQAEPEQEADIGDISSIIQRLQLVEIDLYSGEEYQDQPRFTSINDLKQ